MRFPSSIFFSLRPGAFSQKLAGSNLFMPVYRYFRLNLSVVIKALLLGFNDGSVVVAEDSEQQLVFMQILSTEGSLMKDVQGTDGQRPWMIFRRFAKRLNRAR